MKGSRTAPVIAMLLFALLLGSASIKPARAGEGGPTGPLAPGLLASGAPQGEFPPGMLVVRFKPVLESGEGADAANQAAAALGAAGGSLQRAAEGDGSLQLWQVPVGQEQALREKMSAMPGVAYAELNSVYRAHVVPNDPNYFAQWAHPLIGSPAAWDLTTGSTLITVAVLDTGIDYNHPDLAAKIVAGQDFWEYDNIAQDGNGHGTHVAGIVGAIGNNSVGVAGTSWGARIMPVRVLNNQGSGYNFDITSGIIWAADHGAKVINLSLGGYTFNQAMQDAATYAHNKGVLVVASMGNDDTNTPAYPAAYSNVMAVSATSQSNSLAYYSNFGSHTDIAAPGGEMYGYHDTGGILSTMPTYNVDLTTSYEYYNNYDYLQGTSQASPYVSGLAALVWSQAPGMTNTQVQQAIQNTALDLGASGWDQFFGYGRINAYAAVDYATLKAPSLASISNLELDGSYLVDWGDLSNAATYRLEEDDNSGFVTPVVRYSGTASQYAVSGQAPGLFYYRVRAENWSTFGPWSSVQTAGVVPAVPNLNAINNPDTQQDYPISWNAVSGAGGYELQEANNAAFTGATVRYRGGSTSYNVTGQASGTWYYRVRSYNAAGSSAPSGSASTSVPAAALAAPDLQPISNPQAVGSYTVIWTSVPSASGYVLEASRDPYFAAPVVVYSGTATSLVVNGQIPGTWGYRVRATSAGGNSAWGVPEFTPVYFRVRLPMLRK